MNVVSPDARALLKNSIIQSMSTIDWGKAMARCNEIIQRDLLRFCGLKVFDPELDADCPAMDTDNNSPGFDLIAVTAHKQVRIQSKLRQVEGQTDFSRQVHFETTRRHSAKNLGIASQSGHVAYRCDEFDYVLVTLINVGKHGSKENRHDVDRWSFALIPIEALRKDDGECCVTAIPASTLEKYQLKIVEDSLSSLL